MANFAAIWRVLLIMSFLAACQARRNYVLKLIREARDLESSTAMTTTTATIKTISKNCKLEDCRDETFIDVPKNVMSCLNVCASCVRQWKTGVYNGRECADDCIASPQADSTDPDCNLIKYFNPKVLASLID